MVKETMKIRAIILVIIMILPILSGCIGDGDKNTNMDTKKSYGTPSASILNEGVKIGETAETGSDNKSGTERYEECIRYFLSIESERNDFSEDLIIVPDGDPFKALIATSLSIYYDEKNIRHAKPLLIAGEDALPINNFVRLYEKKDAIAVGEVDVSNINVTIKTQLTGDLLTLSLRAMKLGWKKTPGVLVVNQDNYDLAVSATPIASYLNIPIIVSKQEGLASIVSGASFKYTISVGYDDKNQQSENYFALKNRGDVYEFLIRIIKDKFGCLDYITLTNANDVCDNTIPAFSSLAPYLSTYRQGMAVAVQTPLLPKNLSFDGINEDDIKRMKEEAIYANKFTEEIKIELHLLLKQIDTKLPHMQELYLSILGNWRTIPYYYDYTNVSLHVEAGLFRWVTGGYVMDDYYKEGMENTCRLFIGRPISWSLPATSALIARSCFYYKLIENMDNLHISLYKKSAYLAIGTDWNGALLASTYNEISIYQQLSQSGYVTFLTYGPTSGKTVSSKILGLYEKSSLIHVCAHGSGTGYEMVDGISASDVNSYTLNPSIQLMGSCFTGASDGYYSKDPICLAFIHSGVNAYIGTTRADGVSLWAGAPLLYKYLLEHLFAYNCSIGGALYYAKEQYGKEYPNQYKWMCATRVLYGDPAFNPYEPCNEGKI